MGFFSFAKKVLKPLVDFPKWMDLKQIVKTTKNIKDNSKDMFSVKKTVVVETFEEAMQRLGLTEEDIKQRERLYKWLAAVYTLFAIIIFGYGFYLLSYLFREVPHIGAYFTAIAGAVLSFVIAMILAAFAFRHRFWYFQVKTRYLGYTFKQWWRGDMLGKPLNLGQNHAPKSEPPDTKPS